MRVKTRVNGPFLEEIRWELRWPTIGDIEREMRQKYGRGKGYLYRLIEEDLNTTLDTIDAIYNVLADRYMELGIPIPDDLWYKLLAHEMVDDQEVEDQKVAAP